jgi:hypothetical protein
MADPAAGAPPSDNGAAIVAEQLAALLLKDEDADGAISVKRERRGSISSFNIPPTPPSSLEVPSQLRSMSESAEPASRRPLFGSMREALESAGQMKEEPGGYVIKRRSSLGSGSRQQQKQQQLRPAESTGRAKYRHAKPRPSKEPVTSSANAEEQADAAGYTVIRRRSSCGDEGPASAPSAAAESHSSTSGPRHPRASSSARSGNRKQQRPRRGSMSALQSSSTTGSSQLSSMEPPASSSVPPGFQPCVQVKPPPGLTPAASGWVVKAAAPAKSASKLEEPPVAALWPEMKPSATTPSGWSVATTGGTSETALQAQAWPPTEEAASGSASAEDQKQEEEDDLLARLGVKL